MKWYEFEGFLDDRTPHDEWAAKRVGQLAWLVALAVMAAAVMAVR